MNLCSKELEHAKSTNREPLSLQCSFRLNFSIACLKTSSTNLYVEISQDQQHILFGCFRVSSFYLFMQCFLYKIPFIVSCSLDQQERLSFDVIKSQFQIRDNLYLYIVFLILKSVFVCCGRLTTSVRIRGFSQVSVTVVFSRGIVRPTLSPPPVLDGFRTVLDSLARKSDTDPKSI